MVDYVKLKILNPDIKGIRNLPFLDWDQLTSESTGEIKKHTAKFNGLTIVIINERYLYISGSLHKYWNCINTGIEQNYDDFSFLSLIGSIKDFCDRFNLMPVNCKIQNIEFGVNVKTWIPVNEVLRSIINHKGKAFTQEHAENKFFRECMHKRYIVKIYNKGLQYKRPEKILRFEVKFIKLKDLEPYMISTLADLLERDKITPIGKDLETNFNELLYYDYTIQEMDLTPSKRLILSQGQSSGYWENLKKSNPENYFKKRKRFRELVRTYGNQNIQETTKNLIIQKWNNLLFSEFEGLQDLTLYSSG